MPSTDLTGYYNNNPLPGVSTFDSAPPASGVGKGYFDKADPVWQGILSTPASQGVDYRDYMYTPMATSDDTSYYETSPGSNDYWSPAEIGGGYSLQLTPEAVARRQADADQHTRQTQIAGLAIVGGLALAGAGGGAAAGGTFSGGGTAVGTDAAFGSVVPAAGVGAGTTAAVNAPISLFGAGGAPSTLAGLGGGGASALAPAAASTIGASTAGLSSFGGAAAAGGAAGGAAGLAGSTGGGEGLPALFGDVGMEGGGAVDAAGGGFWNSVGNWGKGLVTDNSGSFDALKAIKLGSTIAPLFGDNTSSSTQTRNIPPWLDAASQGAVGMGAKIATRPYTPYTGERVAPLDPNEQQAYNLARTQGGSFNADLNTARGYANFAARPSTSFDMNAYMNPYIKGALDPAARELRLEGQQQINAAGQQAAMQGSFGGSRGAILESEARRSGTQAVGDLYSKGYAQAFTNAQDQVNVDRQRAAAASEQFRALGAQGQQQLLQQMQGLLTTGGMARANKQAGNDFDYQQFIENRDWDVTNLGPLLASLNVPAGGNVVNSADKSKLQTLAGVGMLLAGGFGGGDTAAAPTTTGMKKPMDTSYPSLWGMQPVGSADDVSSFRRMANPFQPALSESY